MVAAMAGRDVLGLPAAKAVTADTGEVPSDEIKAKILGLNAAALYGIDVAAQKARLARAPVTLAAE